MKKFKKIPVLFLMMLLMITMFSLTPLAADYSDFNIVISAELKGDTLSVVVDITAPQADEYLNSGVYSQFYVGDTLLTKPADTYNEAPLLAQFGETCWIDAMSLAHFTFVNEETSTEAYPGGTQEFRIDFDVSEIDIENGDVLNVSPLKVNNCFAIWNGEPIILGDDVILATCIIDSSFSNVLTASNFTAPTETYFTDAGITVTPSTTDLNFTVASQGDKACVAAKVNEDGTYTVLPATTNDGVHTYTAGSADDQIVVALKGDANGDGNVTNSDVTRMKAILNGKYENSAITALCADANGDSNFMNSDVTRLKAVMNGKSTLSW